MWMLGLSHYLLETGQGSSVLVSQGLCIFLTRLLNVIPVEGGRDYAHTLSLYVGFNSLAVNAGFLLLERT